MKKIFIIGSGTWGTALANILSKNHDVYLYSKFKEEILSIKKNLLHPNLPGVFLNKNIHFTFEKSSCADCDIVIFAVPSIFLRDSAKEFLPYIKSEHVLVSLVKGIESGSLFTMSEVLNDVLNCENKVVVLSGPTHAEEVAKELPSLIVAACKNIKTASIIQKEFSTNKFRIYTTDDVKGVEIGGAFKNIIALACGISKGIGYGDNAIAALITRGIYEISKLGVKLGCNPSTFSGLSCAGDIVVTATSTLSRNFKFGYLIADGVSKQDAMNKIGMVVESLNTLQAAKEMSEEAGVSMPIIDATYDIVVNDKNIESTVNNLFSRKLKSEMF